MSGQYVYPADREARELLAETGRRMYQKGYVVANDGNLSLRVSEAAAWVTPAGVSKGCMTPDMMVKLALDGTVLEGKAKPSSEVRMHLRVYRENPGANAVVHAHPVAATTFAIAGIPLDLPILLEAAVQLGAVPVAGYGATGTDALADSIAPLCRDYAAVLLSNHGALTWGASLTAAFDRLEILENYAAITMNLMSMGRLRLLSKAQLAEIGAIRERLGIADGVAQTGVDEPENLLPVLPGEWGYLSDNRTIIREYNNEHRKGEANE